MEVAETIALLKQNETFSGAPEEVLERLVTAAEHRLFGDGEDLITQGETGKFIWILGSGTLLVVIDGEEVNRITDAGEVFGEISAVSHTAATATVRAFGPVEAIAFSHQDLHKAMEQSPQLAASVLRSMAKYLGR